MSDHVYKLIELTGTSGESIEKAIASALERASLTVRNIRWFEVLDTRGCVDQGRIKEFQVTLKVGFTLDAPGASAASG